jgi:hypothetical protein
LWIQFGHPVRQLRNERWGKLIDWPAIKQGGRLNTPAEQEICAAGDVGARYYGRSLLIESSREPEADDTGDGAFVSDGKRVLLHGLGVGREQKVGDLRVDFQFFLALWRRASEKAAKPVP